MRPREGNAALELVYAADDAGRAGGRLRGSGPRPMTARRAAIGYYLPFQITAWVARYVPAGEGPLLDAGCGTGLSGPALKALGYNDIAGLDLSPRCWRSPAAAAPMAS